MWCLNQNLVLLKQITVVEEGVSRGIDAAMVIET